MDNFLVNSFNLEKLVFSKPKKYADYMLCKVKYPNESGELDDMCIQFPKMTISSDPDEKNLETEFVSVKGYNKEIFNFLSKLDANIVEYISSQSEEWFERKIPKESIKKMYNSFVKAPKTSENRCNLNFTFKMQKNEMKTVFMDKKSNEIEFSQFKKGETVECISQFKYLIFTKDTCFSTWEVISSKLHKKTQKVPKFGFIDDPDDKPKCDSDDEDNFIGSFF
jgi:hypothetical protein